MSRGRWLIASSPDSVAATAAAGGRRALAAPVAPAAEQVMELVDDQAPDAGRPGARAARAVPGRPAWGARPAAAPPSRPAARCRTGPRTGRTASGPRAPGSPPGPDGRPAGANGGTSR